MRRRSGRLSRKGGVQGLVNIYDGDDMIFPGHTGFTLAASAPPGWLPRDGRAVSRTVYAGLFSAIGTAHGAGDGSTTFNLPDDRGNVDVGADLARGVFPGLAVGGFLADGNKSHGHTTDTQGGHAHATDSQGSHAHTGSTDSQGAHTHTANIATGAGGGGSTVGGGTAGGTTNSAGAHTHTVTIAAAGAHTHSTDTQGAHAHTIAAAGNTYATVRSRAGLPIIKY